MAVTDSMLREGRCLRVEEESIPLGCLENVSKLSRESACCAYRHQLASIVKAVSRLREVSPTDRLSWPRFSESGLHTALGTPGQDGSLHVTRTD